MYREVGVNKAAAVVLVCALTSVGAGSTQANGKSEGAKGAEATQPLRPSTVAELMALARGLEKDQSEAASSKPASSAAKPKGVQATAPPELPNRSADNGLPTEGFVPDGKAVDTRVIRAREHLLRQRRHTLLRKALGEYQEARWTTIIAMLQPAHVRGELGEDGTVLLAEALVRAGNPGEASEVLTARLRQPGAGWRAWFWAGTAELARGRLEGAAAYLDKAIAVDAERPEPWIQRAVVEQERGSWEAAKELLRVAASIAPTHPAVIRNQEYMARAGASVPMASSR